MPEFTQSADPDDLAILRKVFAMPKAQITISREGGAGDLNAVAGGSVVAVAFKRTPRPDGSPHAAPDTWAIHDIRKGGAPLIIDATVPRVRAALLKMARHT